MHIPFILTSLLLISSSSFALCGQKKSSRDAEGLALIKEIVSAFDEGARIDAVMLNVLEPYKEDPLLQQLAISYQNRLDNFTFCSQEYKGLLKTHRKLINTNSLGISQKDIEYYEALHESTKELNRRNLIASSELIKILPD